MPVLEKDCTQTGSSSADVELGAQERAIVTGEVWHGGAFARYREESSRPEERSQYGIEDQHAKASPEGEEVHEEHRLSQAFAAWLLEVDPEGNLSIYSKALEESYDTVDQIMRLYCLEEGLLDATFFDDVGIDNADHRRLITEWFARRKQDDPASSLPEATIASSSAANHEEECHASGAELPDLPAPLQEAPRILSRARDETPSGKCWAPLAFLWGGRSLRGDARGPRMRSEPPPKPSDTFHAESVSRENRVLHRPWER